MAPDLLRAVGVRAVGERINLKHAYKQWEWHAELLVVMLTLATFVEDFLRVACDFSGHVDAIERLGAVRHLNPLLPRVARRLIAIALLDLGLVAQSCGVALVLSGLLLSRRRCAAAAAAAGRPSWVVRERGSEDAARAAAARAPLGARLLALWCALHPAVYGQLTNGEFVAESCSVFGGLCILHSLLQLRAASQGREGAAGKSGEDGEEEAVSDDAPEDAHECIVGGGGGEAERALLQRRRAGAAAAAAEAWGLARCAADRELLLGRQLLPSLWSYHAASAALANLTNLVHRHGHSNRMYAFDALAGFAVAFAAGGIIVGLRSRFCALCLGLFNLFFAAWAHLFRGEPLPSVDGIDAAAISQIQIDDLHRYFFFQGLSTSGALLLLALHGPGELAAGAEEKLLPVAIEKD